MLRLSISSSSDGDLNFPPVDPTTSTRTSTTDSAESSVPNTTPPAGTGANTTTPGVIGEKPPTGFPHWAVGVIVPVIAVMCGGVSAVWQRREHGLEPIPSPPMAPIYDA
ncbi:hypothetical protein Dda_5052 [Drechslerella dactyloides]|uniref:Uncharacterized protein n=1 Tax=Drechslerella dactyloides TaxID=74499 RepID=A0AAD6J2C8_DREDA|nr:hypothetical protein Dda_5052 [Drechslerella dactyloides]